MGNLNISVKKVVELAEQYIAENSEGFFNNKFAVNKHIIKLYRPKFTKNEIKSMSEDELKLILLERICFELQNASFKSNCINYEKNKEKIDKIVHEKYNGKHFDLYEKLKSEIGFKDNRNINSSRRSWWQLYSEGIEKFIEYLQNSSKDDLCAFLDTPLDKIKDSSLIKGKNKIPGLGIALFMDFLKELCRDDLVKPDVHIQEIWESLYGLKKPEIIAKNLIELSSNFKEYTPYYVDKVLWLCCSGKFYKDGKVFPKMNRDNFIKYLKDKISIK